MGQRGRGHNFIIARLRLNSSLCKYHPKFPSMDYSPPILNNSCVIQLWHDRMIYQGSWLENRWIEAKANNSTVPSHPDELIASIFCSWKPIHSVGSSSYHRWTLTSNLISVFLSTEQTHPTSSRIEKKSFRWIPLIFRFEESFVEIELDGLWLLLTRMTLARAWAKIGVLRTRVRIPAWSWKTR